MFWLCLKPSFLETYPAFYHSTPCEKLKYFVRSRYFEYGVALVLILNLIAVVIETTVCTFLCLAVYLSLLLTFSHLLHALLDFFQLDIENSSGQKVWQEVEFFFGKSLSLSPSALFLTPLVFEIFGCHVIFWGHLSSKYSHGAHFWSNAACTSLLVCLFLNNKYWNFSDKCRLGVCCWNGFEDFLIRVWCLLDGGSKQIWFHHNLDNL